MCGCIAGGPVGQETHEGVPAATAQRRSGPERQQRSLRSTEERAVHSGTSE